MSNNSKLYVGNLPYSTTKDDLAKLFAEHGSVNDAHIITDRDSGRSRGFGFVEMGNNSEAQKAIDALHGKSMEDRELVVNIARPKRKSNNRPSRY